MASANKASPWTRLEPYDNFSELDDSTSSLPGDDNSINTYSSQNYFDGMEAIYDNSIGNFSPPNSTFLNPYNPIDTDKIAIDESLQPPNNNDWQETLNHSTVETSMAEPPPTLARPPLPPTTFDQRDGYNIPNPNNTPRVHYDSSLPNPSTDDGSVAINEITNSSVRKNKPTLVAVFGKTGTGKTTFIKSVTGLDLITSDKLASCTQNLETFPYKVGDKEILLVDTPGFDDTNLSDTAILFMIADWMEKTYEDGTLLSGIIYLHKITDNRMDGASMKSLRLFRSLCGEDNLSNVILGTTMWGLLDDKAKGEERERELKENYWKEMMDKKTSMHRISTNPNEAKALVESFLPNNTFVTQIQKELKKGMPLSQTGAGAALRDEMEKMSERYQKELKTAEAKMEKKYIRQNATLKKELMAQMETLKTNMARIESEKAKLEKEASGSRLPKQTRGFFTGKWECLGGCRTVTSTKGEWYCKRCKIKQKNIG